MPYKPIPIVIVYDITKRGRDMRQRVIGAGAVDVFDKEGPEIFKGDDVLRRVLLPKRRGATETIVSKRMGPGARVEAAHVHFVSPGRQLNLALALRPA